MVDQQLLIMLQANEIDKVTYDFLPPAGKPGIRTPHFYHLPKIHKKPTHINTIPGRPIISGNSSACENISTFVDLFLQPIAQKQFTFLKDTKSIINKLENAHQYRT